MYSFSLPYSPNSENRLVYFLNYRVNILKFDILNILPAITVLVQCLHVNPCIGCIPALPTRYLSLHVNFMLQNPVNSLTASYRAPFAL